MCSRVSRCCSGNAILHRRRRSGSSRTVPPERNRLQGVRRQRGGRCPAITAAALVTAHPRLRVALLDRRTARSRLQRFARGMSVSMQQGMKLEWIRTEHHVITTKHDVERGTPECLRGSEFIIVSAGMCCPGMYKDQSARDDVSPGQIRSSLIWTGRSVGCGKHSNSH